MAVKLSHVSAAAIMAVALAACGGGSDSSSASSDTADVTEAVTTAAEETTTAVEETVAETTEAAADTAEAATESVADAVSDVADEAEATVEEAAADATETVTSAVGNLASAAQDAADSAQDAVEGAVEEATDRVSAEAIAQYTALTGDAAKGARIFNQCRACHQLAEGRNAVGPSLYGVIGRDAGSIEGFRYSEANANSGITWTEATLFTYLENPRGFIPGTNMAFNGLKRPQDRADVIAYIKSESN